MGRRADRRDRLRGRRLRLLGQARREVPGRRARPRRLARSCSARSAWCATGPWASWASSGPGTTRSRNSFGDCVPALAAGNSVVLKPSEITPLTSLLMAEMLQECGLPEDVFRWPPAGRRRRRADRPRGLRDVHRLHRHGPQGGRAGARARSRPWGSSWAARTRCWCCADADLERAANAATYYSMQNGGQTCISVERVYVEEPVYDEFVRLVDRASSRPAPGRARAARAAWTWARSPSRRRSTSWTRTSRTPARRAPRSPSAASAARGTGASTSPRCCWTWTTR